MKKKGFTLIEITVAVLILAAITLVAVPIIKTTINNSREKAYNITVSTIEDAAKSYYDIHSSDLKNELDSNGYVTITMNELKEEGLVDEKIENPKDNSIMNGNVRIDKIDINQLKYTYIEE